jgi:hypothetical protein
MREHNIEIEPILATVVLLTLCILGGCIEQHELLKPEIPNQCVTPLQKTSMSISPGGISTIHDGSLFGVATNFGGCVSLHKSWGTPLDRQRNRKYICNLTEQWGSLIGRILQQGRTFKEHLGQIRFERERAMGEADRSHWVGWPGCYKR